MNIDGKGETPVLGAAEFEKFVDRCEKIEYPEGGQKIVSHNSTKQKVLKNVKDRVIEMMKVLSIANECVIEKEEYQGPSPDEIELVKFSKQVGFELVNNDKPL